MKASEFLAEFEAEKAKIEADKRLSNQGKAEKIRVLEDDYVSKAKQLKKSLRKIAVMSALNLRDVQAKQRDHLEKAQSDFDYQRLNYEAQAVKAQIARANSLPMVHHAWNKAKASGDKYVIRAWKDTVTLDQFESDPGGFKEKIFEDMASVDIRDRDPELAKREDESLEALWGVEADARALDAFLDKDKIVKRARIEKTVFDGIEFDREGQVQTEFDYQDRSGDYSWSQRKETGAEVADRLESEAQGKVEKFLEVGQRFGVELDPDLDL